MKKIILSLLLVFGFSVSSSFAAPPLWSVEYAKQYCELWNKSSLAKDLVDWAKSKPEGKVIQIYRTDCGADKKVELQIKYVDGMAKCVYAGPPKTQKPDFLMYTSTKKWEELGKGKFGFGGFRVAMMRKLKFEGSMKEAMANMGAFKTFLLNVGKIPYSKDCP
jgi:putative sterol carrier protein